MQPERKRTKSTRETGARYEILAAEFLRKQGYEILEQNFYSRNGEIDIVAKDGETLVFVEVKYRSCLKAGDPTEAVDKRKQERIRKTAGYYLYARNIPEEHLCRFDVVAVLGEKVSLLQNAF